MNFTREPVVETVITPKEGYKLAIRNSKGGTQEDFIVDSIEVISFGNTCFYRSTERPKAFVVPIGDYEVLEVRETRLALKTPSPEKAAQPKAEEEEPKKKEKKRRRRRGRTEKEEEEAPREEIPDAPPPEKRALIPPPPTLISQTYAPPAGDAEFAQEIAEEVKDGALPE